VFCLRIKIGGGAGAGGGGRFRFLGVGRMMENGKENGGGNGQADGVMGMFHANFGFRYYGSGHREAVGEMIG